MRGHGSEFENIASKGRTTRSPNSETICATRAVICAFSTGPRSPSKCRAPSRWSTYFAIDSKVATLRRPCVKYGSCPYSYSSLTHTLRHKLKYTDLPLGEWSGLLSYSMEYWPGIHSWRYKSDATHSGSIDRAASCGGHMCRMRGGSVDVVSAMARRRGRGSTRRRLCSVRARVESASSESLTPRHRSARPRRARPLGFDLHSKPVPSGKPGKPLVYLDLWLWPLTRES